MKAADAMTRHVALARPEETVQAAAVRMAQEDVGFLPVRDDTRLVGIITDRDIAIRAVARGKSGQTLVRDIMTCDVKYCFDDDDMDFVAKNMGENQLRRMPVVDRKKRLVGVVTLADEALKDSPAIAGRALRLVVDRADLRGPDH